MKYILVIIPLALLLSSCEISEFGYGGDIVIQGQILIPDTLTSQLVPLQKAEVRLGLNVDNRDDYILKTESDAEGYYVFKKLFIPNKNVIQIFCAYQRNTKNDKRLFSSQAELYPGDSLIYLRDLKLEPNDDIGAHLIEIKVEYQDLFSKNTIPVSSYKVGLSSNNNSFASIERMSSGNFIYFTNLKSGSYQLSVGHSVPYGSFKIPYDLDTNIILVPDQTEHNFLLKTYPKEVDFAILKFVAQDSITPQSSIAYCLYDNLSTFEKVACDSSKVSGEANKYGMAILKPVVPGARLFIDAYNKLDPDLRVRDTLNIGREGILTKILTF